MNRKEFILQLIAEVAHYILDADPMRMVISLHQEEDGLHLAILDNVPRDEGELNSIRSVRPTIGRSISQRKARVDSLSGSGFHYHILTVLSLLAVAIRWPSGLNRAAQMSRL